MQQNIKKIILILNILLVIVTGMSLLSTMVHPEKSIFFAFAGLLFPWVVIANIVFSILWLFLEKKWALISLATLIFAAPQFHKYISLDNPGIVDDIYAVQIASYNLKQGYEIREHQDRQDAFVKFLYESLNVDIFCTQEVSSFTHGLIVDTRIFNHIHRINGRGTVIYSKYPIIHAGQIDFNTKTNSCLWADIVMPRCTLRVYSFHLQSNNISKDAEKVMDEGELQKVETWTGVRNILAKYKYSARIRARQADQIQAHIQHSPYPVVLTGDLNDPPQSFVYKTISQGFSDSFLEKGFGFGTSFAGRIPSLRIDYIFADPKVNIMDHRVIKERFSDHFPIKAVLNCPEE